MKLPLTPNCLQRSYRTRFGSEYIGNKINEAFANGPSDKGLLVKAIRNGGSRLFTFPTSLPTNLSRIWTQLCIGKWLDTVEWKTGARVADPDGPHNKFSFFCGKQHQYESCCTTLPYAIHDVHRIVHIEIVATCK